MQINRAYQFGVESRPEWTRPLKIVNRPEPPCPDPDILYALKTDWIVETEFDDGAIRFCVIADPTFKTLCGGKV